MLTKATSSTLATAVAAIIASTAGHASPIYYDELVDFDNDLGAHHLAVENFEGYPSNRPSGWDFGSYVVETDDDVDFSYSVPGTNGPRTLKITEGGDDYVRFIFAAPITAFRIDLIDALDVGGGDLIVTVDGGTPYPFVSGANLSDENLLFLGIIDEDGFTSVMIDGTDTHDYIYYDNMRYSAISEPPLIALFGLGLMGLGILRRRRS